MRMGQVTLTFVHQNWINWVNLWVQEDKYVSNLKNFTQGESADNFTLILYKFYCTSLKKFQSWIVTTFFQILHKMAKIS